jgi:hypothetical protein
MNTADEWAIVQVINRYGIAMDARRWDLFATIFTPDVELEYPSGMAWNDREKFRVDFAEAHKDFDATQHAMLNHLVEVHGDEASAFTYVWFRLIRRGTPGGDFFEGFAWYDDALVRTDGGWRIKRRHCRMVWNGGNPAAIGASKGQPWDVLRDEAAGGRVAYLAAFDGKRR